MEDLQGSMEQSRAVIEEFANGLIAEKIAIEGAQPMARSIIV